MKVASKIKPVNNSDFKIADAEDIAIDNSNVKEKIVGIENANELIKRIEINVKNPPNGLEPCIGDGSDETAKIQACIDYLNNSTTSNFTNNARGVLKFPTGVYGVKNLIMKSNLIIQGNGIYSTRFKPLSDNGFVFDITGVNNTNRIANVSYRDFTIAPTSTFTNFDSERCLSGGINVSYSTNVNLSNVAIFNLDGINILSTNQFDSSFDNITIMYSKCKDYAFKLSSDGDTSNAIHVSKLRLELCQNGLGLIGCDGVQVREIQFALCKFENVGIKILGSNSIVFNSCHFTIKDGFSIEVDSLTDIDCRSIIFNGCTCLSANGTGTFINNASGVNVNINGCSFSNIKTIATGINFNLTSISTYDIKGDCFNVSKSLLNNIKIHTLKSDNKSTFENCKISNCELNKVVFNGNVICVNTSINDLTTTGQNNNAFLCNINKFTDNGSANEIETGARFRGVANNDLLTKGHMFWVGDRLAIRTSNNSIKYITLTD